MSARIFDRSGFPAIRGTGFTSSRSPVAALARPSASSCSSLLASCMGTMRATASAFDVRANTGERPMIVPLWGLNSAESTHIFVRSAHDSFVVTWRAMRYQHVSEG